MTPELQCDPKLIHEIRKTANNLANNGGCRFASWLLLVAPRTCVDVGSNVDTTTGSRTLGTDFEISIARISSSILIFKERQRDEEQ